MAGSTLLLQVGLVCAFLIVLRFIMAEQAKEVGRIPGQHLIILHPVTGVALPLVYRIMYIFFKQHRPITGMGGMTLQATTLDRVLIVRPDKRCIVNLMAGSAKGIRGTGQQGDIV